ncbi:Hypothetical predicted protein [Cloeon dipterum]|uniref:C-type lectin domain-containing protein n=1 Tax=Cloeon dipterum TaxID=197152 RepID=A0A8S1D4X1_9INSE|nr:Hypothetical predicted protein [Cloeon dipterum]
MMCLNLISSTLSFVKTIKALQTNIALVLILSCLMQVSQPQVKNVCKLSGYATRSSFVWQNSLGDISNQLNCFSDCLDQSSTGGKVKRDFSKLQFLFERVYSSRRIFINCDLNLRYFTPYCRLLLKQSAIPQMGTRRYFHSATLEMNYFEAQKFCRTRNLFLVVTDIKSKELEILSLLASAGTLDTTGKIRFWGDSRAVNGTYFLTGKTSIAMCSAFSVSKTGDLFKYDEPCKTKQKFICDVPAQCYAEFCAIGTGGIGKPGEAVPIADLYCTAPTCPKCTATIESSPPVDGKIKTYCGKNFFVSASKATFDEAASICCLMKMDLLSIESESEENCVTDLLSDKEIKSTSTPEFWTSASSSGCPSRFSWCSSRVSPVPKWLWADGEPSKKECVVTFLTQPSDGATYSEAALKTRDCTQATRFICSEQAPYIYDTVNSSCAQECFSGKCTSKAIAASFNFRVATPIATGTIKSVCGSNYYIGKSTRNWFESESACCEDRMELAAITDENEIDCVRELIISLNENWRSGPFWVGGTDVKCPLNFAWCGAYLGRQPLSLRFNRTLKHNNRRGNSCIAVDMNPAKTGLVAMKCDSMLRYLCKDVRTCLPECPNQCPIIKSAAMKKKIQKSRVKRNVAADDEEEDDEEEKPGHSSDNISPKATVKDTSNSQPTTTSAAKTFSFTSISACGRSYLLSNAASSFTDAYAHCCSKNMRLLSLDTRNEGDCLYEPIRTQAPANALSVAYWTSGTDNNCKGYFVWCGTGEYFSALELRRANPSAMDGKDCLVYEVDVKKKAYVIRDDPCNMEYKFVCEPAN